MLLLRLSPNIEELEEIAKFGSPWTQEALWATLALDPALVASFLKDMIYKSSISFWLEPTRNHFDYHGDSDSNIRAEALEVVRRLRIADDQLLESILFRATFDIESNRHLAEEMFISFGAKAVSFLREVFFKKYNRYVYEMFFQNVIDGLEAINDEKEIKVLLKEVIQQNRAMEKFRDELDAPERQKKLEEKLQEKQTQREKLHYFLQNPPTPSGRSYFFKTVNDVKDYGIGAVDFLDELCALAENENLDRDTRSAALTQIANLGPLAGGKCEIVCKLVDHPLYYGEAFAALVAMKFAAAPILPRVLQLLRHENWVMCAHAVAVIGAIGPAAALLYDSHIVTRWEDAKVLEQIKVHEPRVIEALYIAAHRPSVSRDSGIQGAAARALRSVLAEYDIPAVTRIAAIDTKQRKRLFWIF